MRKGLLLMLLITATAFSSYAQQAKKQLPKFSFQQLQTDANLLKKILEANHPSLYWHTAKEILDSSFNTMLANLTDSLNELEFKNRISTWVTLIKCGHTAARPSDSFIKNINDYRYPRFPLSLKVWNDSMVVIANALSKDTILKRGTILTAINGKPVAQITNELCNIIPTDGNAINHKYQVISNNFSDWYKTYYGVDSIYTIDYISQDGHTKTTTVKNFEPPKRDSSGKRPVVTKPLPDQPSKRALLKLSRRSLSIDTANATAFIRLTTFSKGNLKRFFRRTFRKIEELKLTKLVIDVRENGGGKVDNSVMLTQYLINHPFKIGDSVVAISRKFEYGRYIKPKLFYWIAMNFGAHKMEDGSIHYRRFERHYFKPRSKNHFDGKVYLIQGGYTFSAATMFIAALKGQENITVLGEETGGGYYGNSAMHIPTITLPNSKLRVSLPLYRLVMNKNRAKGRGIIPDVYMPPSSYAIKNGFDPKLSAFRRLAYISP